MEDPRAASVPTPVGAPAKGDPASEVGRAELTAGPPPGSRTRIQFVDGIRARPRCTSSLHHIWLAAWPDFPARHGPW